MRVVLPSSDRWQQCARYKPIRRRPHSVDCTTTLNDRCARDACSFDGKLVDDTLFTIRQTTPVDGKKVVPLILSPLIRQRQRGAVVQL